MECIHFPDDPNANCALCKPKPKVDLWESISEGVIAKYYGPCALCPGTIYPEDIIVETEDGWAHKNCREDGRG